MNIQDEKILHKDIAQELLPLLGGKENIVKMTHCTTRLRFELKNESKVNKAAIDELNYVHGTFSRLGLFQMILGSGIVNKVYRAILETNPTPVSNTIHKIERPKVRINPFVQFAKTLSNIFVPIIPAIVASGLLMGFIGMIKVFKWASPAGSLMIMLDIFSSAAFIILPILIGFSAAKEFGGNQVLGAVIGGILTHPSLLNPSMLGYKMPAYLAVLGVDIPLIGYQGTVIPILLSVFIMSKLELSLRKVVPSALDLFFIPFLSIICIGFISLLLIGPISLFISDIMTTTFELVYRTGAVAGFLFGGVYSLIVVTGLHHTLHAVEIELLANPEIGINFLLPIWSMANIAQGGAGLAVFFKTKNERMKKIAIPSAFLAFLGIIEPVMFGINIKLIRPFIGAAIGGAFGGAYIVLTHVVANSYGLTGIPMIAIVAPIGMSNLINYLLGLGISAITAFIATWILSVKEETE